MSAPRGGIHAAIVTPVDGGGGVDAGRMAAHARRLLAGGCHGLAVFGTTGEANSFSVAQRQAALDALLAAGVPAGRVILGVGTCARDETLALARHGLGLGCRRLLVQPPFFYKRVSDEGLFAAFAEVAEAAGPQGAELLLYHFPQVTQVPVTRPVIERLVDAFPSVVRGVKDSSGDLDHTLGLAASFPGLAVYAGNDSHLLDVLRAGGAGTISAAANLNAAASRAVHDAFGAGDAAAAEAGMGRVTAVRKVLESRPLIPAIKHVLAEAEGDPAWARVRPPLTPLDAAAGAELRRDLAAAGWRRGGPEARAAA
jgi:4-hydroxy-tetrahydrodipicolinate synthase